MKLIAVGKIRESLMSEIEFYKKQMPKLSIVEIKDSDKEKEGIQIMKHIKDAYVIGLAINGKTYDSISFSEHIYKLQTKKNVTFIIGGSEGLSQEIINKCDELISLSNMTLPHGLARVVFVEQLYRAIKIIERHPYHK